MAARRHPLLRALQSIGVTTVGIQIEQDLSTNRVSRGELLLLNPSGQYPLSWWLPSGKSQDVAREEFAEVLARQAGRVVYCRPAELMAEASQCWEQAQLERAIRRSARSSRRTGAHQPARSLDGADHDGLSGAVEQLLGSLDVTPAGEFIEPAAWGYETWKPRDPRVWASWLGPAPYRRDADGRIADGRRTRRSQAPDGVCQWCWAHRRSDDRPGERYSSGQARSRTLVLCNLCAAQSRLIGGYLPRAER